MTCLTIFASGSSGNCALISAGGVRFLVDAGISLRRLTAGLAREGLSPDDLSGVFITHEHSDHVSGLAMLLRYHPMPVYAPRTVASRLLGMLPDTEEYLEVLHTSESVAMGEARVTAFHTWHDTPESVGYRVDGEASLGVCTDLGAVTDEVREALRGVSAAVVEANHDEERLRYGPYPAPLKRRILSDHGHLSNADCGGLCRYLAENGARTLVLGHLSRENNTPELALRAVNEALAGEACPPRVLVAPPFGALTVEVNAPCWA